MLQLFAENLSGPAAAGATVVVVVEAVQVPIMRAKVNPRMDFSVSGVTPTYDARSGDREPEWSKVN